MHPDDGIIASLCITDHKIIKLINTPYQIEHNQTISTINLKIILKNHRQIILSILELTIHESTICTTY